MMTINIIEIIKVNNIYQEIITVIDTRESLLSKYHCFRLNVYVLDDDSQKKNDLQSITTIRIG